MATAAVLAATTMDWSDIATASMSMSSNLPIDTGLSVESSHHSSGPAGHASNSAQSAYTHFFSSSHAPSTLNAHRQQPAPSSSLFSRTELQAIDGFLESFSAPLSSLGPSSSSASSSTPYSAGYGTPSHPQAPPYSSSTAFYRPEYETGWRAGPPTTTASSIAPTLYNNQHNKYISYHPTAYHRPSSPSSASASSSSYPKTLGQADHHNPSFSTSTSARASGHSAIRPPRISTSPFSSASHAEESPDEREKRLRTQAEDLAGWLSRYKYAGQLPSPHTMQASSNALHHQQSHSSSSAFYEASSVPPLRPVQGSGPSSTGSTSNSESLPTPSSRIPTGMPYLDFVASDADSTPNVIKPSEMSLLRGKQTNSQTSAEKPLAQGRSNSEKVVAAESTSDLATCKAKTKSSKPAGPPKKKASSTTASVREKKQPLAKPPARKAAKVETSHATVSALEKTQTSPTIPDQTREASSSTPDVGSVSSAAAKTALTEEQKRANHIASEQKRRHAIRAAYDALCTVVPSLRAAVQEYEDRLSKLQSAANKTTASAGDEDGMDVDHTPAFQTVAGVLTGGIEVGGEKIDGRAGPRSEAVVLAKSEHVIWIISVDFPLYSPL